MHQIRRNPSIISTVLLTTLVLLASGCRAISAHRGPGVAEVVPEFQQTAPRELAKTALPPYTIEPPDILMIDAVHIMPRPPYRLRTADVLSIYVPGTLPDAPIEGAYPLEPGGLINLGPPYGSVSVGGLTTEEARHAIEHHLSEFLVEPNATVNLLQMAAMQHIAGQHLVGPDGMVTLGTYGKVSVVGMTVEEARFAIETHLAQFLEDPEVSVDVFAYNSKVYYVITEGAGMGDGVIRFPITGNETVLDAISNINGLTQISSKRIWIARPVPFKEEVQILPVEWKQITAKGVAGTNYQLFPGDRVFIEEDKLVAFDTGLAKLTAPIERLMGFTTLGVSTVARLSGPVLRGGGLRGRRGLDPVLDPVDF